LSNWENIVIVEEFSDYRIMRVDSVEGTVTLGRTYYIKRDGDIISQTLDSKEVSSDIIKKLLNDIIEEAKLLNQE